MTIFRYFFLLLVLVVWAPQAQAEGRLVNVLTVKGVINPVSAEYLVGGIDKAKERKAELVVIELDTPGGLDTSMRDINQAIINSAVPVVVYVAPPGARAASAGLFILMAGHVAAMSPDSATGAAHPVPSGGGELDKTMEAKVTNDAVAYIRGLAEKRGRNADFAERAVRKSVSISAEEAKRTKVIEVVAPSLDELLKAVDGKTLVTQKGKKTVDLKTPQVQREPMQGIQKFLYTISDPNIAYLLLSLGMLALWAEFSNPGAILPGVVGSICILVALLGLGMLPVNYAGVALILVAFLMFLAEIFVTSYGLLTVGGLIAFVLGSLILIRSDLPGIAVDRGLIATVAMGIAAVVAILLNLVLKTQRSQPTTGREGLIGMKAVVRQALKPKGTVFVDGALWAAVSEAGEIDAGETVVVTAVQGLTVTVNKEGENGV